MGLGRSGYGYSSAKLRFIKALETAHRMLQTSAAAVPLGDSHKSDECSCLSLSVLHAYEIFAVSLRYIRPSCTHFKMFCDEEREFILEIWNSAQNTTREISNNMDIVQNSILHDVEEPAMGLSPSSAGAEGQAVEGPRKISPRPWLMAPKNLAFSRVIALPVTAVTAAAIIFYSRESISAGAAKFDDMQSSQTSVRQFVHTAKSNIGEKFLSTRFPSSSSSFAQLHGANPSWDRVY